LYPRGCEQAENSNLMVRTGIAGWIDRELIQSRLFYPMHVTSSEERLRFYASQFPLVEVDSTYYGMPKKENSVMWVERTPEGFRFDIKSFSLFTHHPTKAASLPKPIRDELPAKLLEGNFYVDKTPPEVVDLAWEAFREALQPLQDAGRLGAVLFQFPAWFFPSSRSLTYIEQCQERMFGFQVAVEFRKRQWLDYEHADGTLDFLRSHGIPYVTVDAPQGYDNSMPPIIETTSDRLAVVRFHGRNHETWNQKGAPPSVRFRYLYPTEELQEWVPRIRELEQGAAEVHAIMNNNYSNYSVRNARELAELLEAPEPAA
jgi:uncharacterized protein YecE (DUF72 family)